MAPNQIPETTEPKTFQDRIAATKTTRWIRFSIVALVFIAWVIWMGNPWLLILLFLLFDIYITGYIPFTWWKKSKNKVVRQLMSWVDAIIYALILVYFVFAFVGQNYQIPSSSLEKTLLTGDYLFVNKMLYGPRVPMTPVYFPLVHNEFPNGTKSYLDSPSLSYHRLKGIRKIERGDIVVFNFPAGDTIVTKVTNPDYYTLIETYGRDRVLNDVQTFGKQVYRPVDRRENYVKRAVGLPGDNFKIIDGVIYINDEPMAQPENVQFNYFYQMSRPIEKNTWEELGISEADRHLLNLSPEDSLRVKGVGLQVNPNGTIPPVYVGPLTQSMIKKLESMPELIKIEKTPSSAEGLYPRSLSTYWTLSDYGGDEGIVIPAKGMTVNLDPTAWALYERPIRVYEGNETAYLGNDERVYINGEPAEEYTFKMDYYFMMGDNRDNSLDSRFWGFVPEDHIVGSPWRVLISFDNDRSLFDGGIRWNRILKDANPDKN